ncbi:hypothetical protein GCM10009841_31480 [Microlunatus panaciterrae]
MSGEHHHRRRLAGLLTLIIGFAFVVTVPAAPAAAATCPCTIWTASQTPTTPADSDTAAVEVGVKFRSSQDGFITGIRFYKGTGNTGTHVGSLWNLAGVRMATVTFSGETSTGWQQANFASPVAVTANTTYIASYYAPNGRYAGDNNYFASAVTNGPLTALQNGTDGGNGVYRYGVGGGFPTSSYQASNYWVDVVFDTGAADTTKPTVTDRQPAAGATGVSVGSSVSATFSEAVDPASISLTLTGPAGAVTGAKSYDSATRTVAFTPGSSLATSTTYTVNLSGAKDAAGNVMDPLSWTFSTAATSSGCPCSIWADTATPAVASTNDSSAVELGVKFRADRNGFVTGIRFFKGTGNTGTHVGSLWTSAGTRLAQVTFSGESSTGWQRATFTSPVSVSANTTYIASYYAPVGRYSSDNDYFASASTVRGPLTALRDGTDGGNGVYRYGASGFPNSTYRSSNYWVDVVFDTSSVDTTAPVVVAQSPAAGASGVPTTTSVTATFSEPVTAGSVAMELRGPGNVLVPAAVSYDSSTQTATLTPNSALAESTGYTATVSGAKDSSGNTMQALTWSFTTAAPPPPGPEQGPGGPVAVVTSGSNPYSKYLAEILRAEGLNEFATVDVGSLSAATLASYDVVVLGNVTVTAAQATVLSDWVNAGGNLIAMRPSNTLASLLGLTLTTGTTSNAYLKVDTSTAAGAGIVSDTIQFHGAADRYSLSGAQAIATLYSSATASTTFPAVTLRTVGTNGGQAAAFTFDLARSIVQTRQGNPAWAGTERDSQAPIRSDDLYFGTSTTSWVNLAKVAIPQADEQQRLLANLIQVMNRDKKPLPHFWYLPKNLKAVVLATGDDHGNGGTAGRFDQYEANSPTGCSVADWTCLRFSSYIFPGTPLSNTAAAGYNSRGFEVGVHVQNGCTNFTPASLANNYAQDLSSWAAAFPSLPRPVSNRFHCIVYSDWASQPKTELANGMRMDANYYYWPSSWINDRPGFMTGSGMPMRFTDTDGSMIDVYQAATQMTDESGQSYPFTPDTLLDNALGPLGYYGVFNANVHTDSATTFENDQLMASAMARGVPMISGRQLLTWTDGRNASSFGKIGWSANTLSFDVAVGAGANGLTGMLPTAGPGGTVLTGISRNGSPVTFTTSTVKGLEYASFPAAAGSYTASYAATGAPAITQAQALTVESGTLDEATVSWTTTEPTSSEVTYGTTPSTLSSTTKVGGATRKHAVRLPGLKRQTTYYYRVVAQDTSGNVRTYPATTLPPLSFTTPKSDVAKPVLTGPVVTPLPDGTAAVRWASNEKADSVVRFGRSTARLGDLRLSRDLVKDHAVVLTGLQPDHTYWFDVTSTDAAGNATVGKPLRFTTPAAGVAEQTAPAFRRGDTSGSATVTTDGFGSVTLSGAATASRQGTFVSGVLDARAMVDWDRATWQATTPAGSKLTVSVRTGSTAKVDGNWSAWRTLAGSGARVVGSSRYVQYRVEMSSPAGVAAPSMVGIGITHNGGPITAQGEGR